MQIVESMRLSDFLMRVGREDISGKIISLECINHLRNICVDSRIYVTLTNSTPEQEDIAALSGALRPESGLLGEAQKIIAALLSSWTECPICGDFLSASLHSKGESRYSLSMSCRRNHADNVYMADDLDLFLNPHGRGDFMINLHNEHMPA